MKTTIQNINFKKVIKKQLKRLMLNILTRKLYKEHQRDTMITT